jgi:hypothetical protein
MGRESSPKAGLSLEDHRDLGDMLRAIRVDVGEVRTVVQRALGSAADPYASLGKILQAVGVAENALRREAEQEYGDDLPTGLYGAREGT